MKYTKKESIGGEWLRAAELESGTKLKIVGETRKVPGEYGDRDVAKVEVNGFKGEKNVNINQTSLNAFIDAFGDESSNWIGKVVTAQTEKAIIAGKRRIVLYLIPDGFALQETTDGYIKIVRVNGDPVLPSPTLEVEEIQVEDIPF